MCYLSGFNDCTNNCGLKVTVFYRSQLIYFYFYYYSF